jgi:hypothetical protein
MFWYLLFAHLLADYPLQPTWMVMQKTRLGVLMLHVGIHFGVMLSIVGAARQILWPYLLLITMIHFAIDLVKNWFTAVRPRWVIGPYIVDQIVHYVSLWAVTIWIGNRIQIENLPWSIEVLKYLTAYLFVTYVWFISERIFAHHDAVYRREVIAQSWSRMFARVGFLSGLLFFWRWFFPAALRSTITFPVPYVSGQFRIRAFITDLGVSLAGMIFILLSV